MSDAGGGSLKPEPLSDDAFPLPLGQASVSDGLASILATLVDPLLTWTAHVRDQSQPEAIHQARVATRRLRSALSIYRTVWPTLAPLADDVRQCAGMLGAVRDWDVFIAGTGATLVTARDDEPRIAQLMRAAARKRRAAAVALAAYLASPDCHRLEAALGQALADRPWHRDEADLALLQGPTAPFAATLLTRYLKRARRRGRSANILPIEALHDLRKDCKRLRYAAEFFAPAFPGRPVKPFLRRLSDLQGQLGMLNDTASSHLLLAQLGRTGRGYAAGLVEGWVTAAAEPARARIVESWKRFDKAEPFWK